ncbi:hypothetical protein IAU59_007399 [Kwoniella sp. CBS 9459]
MAANTNERIKGIQVHRPIIYGSHARLLTEEEKALAPIGHTHRWTVFFTSASTPPPNPSASSSSSKHPISAITQDQNADPQANVDMDYIPGGQDDLSYLIKKVTFKLHETYPNPNRVCDKPPFRVTETGWGEFVVQIRIQFIPESLEKPITLNHPIKLHHWGAPIEGVTSLQTGTGSLAPTEAGTANGTNTAANSAANTPAPASAPAPAPATASVTAPANGAGTSAGSADDAVENQAAANNVKSERKAESGSASVKVEGVAEVPASTTTSQAQQPKSQALNEAASAPTPPDTPAAETKTENAPASTPAADADAGATAADADADGGTEAGNDSMVIDSEIVVDADMAASSAPLSIASMLPVHSWQYDELIFSDPPRGFLDILNENPPTPLPAKNRRPRDQRDEWEKKTQPPSSKKGKPSISAGGRGGSVRGSRANTEVGTPGPAIGIPGEPGSADVPLEFSGEMEKGEYNKLMDARRKIVEQMDKWRERLIAQEKELNKLKDEVKAM